MYEEDMDMIKKAIPFLRRIGWTMIEEVDLKQNLSQSYPNTLP